MIAFLQKYQLDMMLALSAACFTFALLLFITRFMDKKRKQVLILMEFVATFLLFFDRLAYIYSGDTSYKGYIMVRVSNFFVFFFTSGIVFSFNKYLIDLVTHEGHEEKAPILLSLVGYGAIGGMAIVVINLFNGYIYYFDQNNVYHRGEGFLICYIIPVICPFIQYAVIRNYKKCFSKMIYISLLIYIFVPIFMGILQIFVYGVSLVNTAMVMVSISLYVFNYLDINETVIRAHKYEMKELQEEKKSMTRLFDQTAKAFINAVERRNPYFEGYSERMAEFARRLAKAVGKTEDECDEVYYAALLHNVGFTSIPEGIISKQDNLSPEEAEIFRRVPEISSQILSGIREYPYLQESALYSYERYDGTGFPKGLKGEEIPEISRFICVADVYNYMSSSNGHRSPLPYITIREEFVKNAGVKYDAEIANAMVRIMDRDFVEAGSNKTIKIEKELKCEQFRDAVSSGIPITSKITKISFKATSLNLKGMKFSAPYLLLFDSFDARVHYDPKAINAFYYYEYGEVWFDGHFNNIGARNMEVNPLGNTKPKTSKGSFAGFMDIYEVEAARYKDHIRLEIKSSNDKYEVIMALDDDSKAAYISLTGENCHIWDIEVAETDNNIRAEDIKRIAGRVSYIDRIESDLPNVQIIEPKSIGTESVLVEDGLRIAFHTMSLPAASLVWHCPYIVLFTSDDKTIKGNNYKEYALIKINGEVSEDEGISENKVTMKRKENFPGWDEWKRKNKAGFECSVFFDKKGNSITVSTENLGIYVENTTTILDGTKDIYVALSGDQVALTDIRVR